MNNRFVWVPLIAVLALVGCASLPDGPSVTALPGSRMSFDRFRQDDLVCRDYAYTRIGGKDAQQTAIESAQQSAVLGTVLGGAAGAAIDGEHGAGVGAATGLLVGTLAGLDAGMYAGSQQQQRYDGAYIQCMYAKGHRVPVSAQMIDSRGRNAPPPPPRTAPPGVPPDYRP